MEPIKIIICDDAKYICDIVREHLKNEPDIEVIADAYNYEDALDLTIALNPDILLLDVQLETEKTGIDVLPEFKEQCPNTKIIMYTSYDYDEYIYDSIISGATDYLLKSATREQIIEKIKNVYYGKQEIQPEIFGKFLKKSREMAANKESMLYIISNLVTLSISELEVLKLLYYGYSYKEIAEKKFVESGSVRTLSSRIVKKMKYTDIKTLIKDLQALKIFDEKKGL